MNSLLRLSAHLDRIVIRIGMTAAWLAVPMVAVIIFDVVTRRFFVLGSTKLQEMEWHLHAGLFLMCLAYAYLKGAHVRVDLLRETLSPRTKAWIEFLGCFLFLIPYAALIVYFGWDFAARSFQQHEVSGSMTGLPMRWIIKSAIPVGFVLVLMAGISVLIRKFVYLFGPRHLTFELASPHLPHRAPSSKTEI